MRARGKDRIGCFCLEIAYMVLYCRAPSRIHAGWSHWVLVEVPALQDKLKKRLCIASVYLRFCNLLRPLIKISCLLVPYGSIIIKKNS